MEWKPRRNAAASSANGQAFGAYTVSVACRVSRLAISLTFWTTALFFISGATTLPPSISVVTSNSQAVHQVKLWDRASLFCKNFLVEHGFDLSDLPPEFGACRVDWYKGNKKLCRTVDGRCECEGSRKFARHGGVILTITRVTQAASGVYTCQYPAAPANEHHRSHMEFQLTVDARTRHLSLYNSLDEVVVLPTNDSSFWRELKCWFNGNPTPTVTWTKDGVELNVSRVADRIRNVSFPNMPPETRRLVSLHLRSRKDMSKLNISIASFDEESQLAAASLVGRYQCHIRNSESSRVKTFSVKWDYLGRGLTSGAEAASTSIRCAYFDRQGLCTGASQRYAHDPVTGSVIDCVNMTDQCPSGVCIAAYQAVAAEGGKCRYQQKIGRCQPLQTDCDSQCTAESNGALNNSVIQCCCKGNLCNQNVRLPATCQLARTTVDRCNEESGYFWNTTSDRCEDLNECDPAHVLGAGKLNVERCVNMLCNNTLGSYTCQCRAGYRKLSDDDMTCLDVDECAAGSHGCRGYESCLNTEGSFDCIDTRSVNQETVECEVVSCAPCDSAEATAAAAAASSSAPGQAPLHRRNTTHCCWPHVHRCAPASLGVKVGCFTHYDCAGQRPISGQCLQMRRQQESNPACELHCGYPFVFCHCEGNLCNSRERLVFHGRSVT